MITNYRSKCIIDNHETTGSHNGCLYLSARSVGKLGWHQLAGLSHMPSYWLWVIWERRTPGKSGLCFVSSSSSLAQACSCSQGRDARAEIKVCKHVFKPLHSSHLLAFHWQNAVK